jgi:serine/threonine-protein kinase RsbW
VERESPPTVRLDLESRPETLTIVRGMLGGLAELLTIDPELLDDLKTTVSEACNNVVLHAYGGEPGPMEIRLAVDPARVRMTVEDQGVGIPEPAVDRNEGIGLSVIRALADTVQLAVGEDGGTRVVMEFAAERDGRSLFELPGAAGPDLGWVQADGGEVVISLSPVRLLAGVLGRLARTLAATAHFSLDRFSDVYLVTDTLAAHAAKAAAGPRIDARVSAAHRRLDMVIGPFRSGTSKLLGLERTDRAASPLVLLSDEVVVRPEGEHELLSVVVIDRRN